MILLRINTFIYFCLHSVYVRFTMVTITVRSTPPSQRRYPIGGRSLSNGSYVNSRGQKVTVRSTPESERKYPVPISEQGRPLRDTGGVLTTSGGRIVGTYEESTPSAVDSAMVQKIKNEMGNEYGYTPSPNVSTQYGVAYASSKNGRTEYALSKADYERAQKNKVRSDYTGGQGTYGIAPKKNSAVEFIGGAFDFSKENFKELKTTEKVTSRQAGAVFSFPLTVATLGVGSYAKSSYSVAGKTYSTFSGAYKASKAVNVGKSFATFRSLGGSAVSYTKGGFPIGSGVVYGLGGVAGFTGLSYAGKKTYSKFSDRGSLTYAQQQEIYGEAERQATPQYTQDFLKISNPKEAFTYAKETGRGIAYGLVSGAGDEKAFTSSVQTQLQNRGYTKTDAERIAKSFRNERRFVSFGEVGTVVGAEVVGEVTGRRGVVFSILNPKRQVTAFTKKEAFKTTFKQTFKPLFVAGAGEGMTAYSTQTVLRSQPFKTSELAFYGFAGGSSAGILGGTLASAEISTTLQPTITKKIGTKTYKGLLYASDAPEWFGDRATDILERQVTKRTGYQYPKVYTVSGFTRANTFTFGISKTNTGVFSQSNTLVNSKNKVSTNLLTNTKTTTNILTNIFTSTTTTNTLVNTKANNFVPTMSFTPAISTAVSSNVNIPSNVPTVVPALKFPIIPIPSFGKGGGYGRYEKGRGLRKTAYVTSLSAGLFGFKGRRSGSVLTGFEIREPRKKRRR